MNRHNKVSPLGRFFGNLALGVITLGVFVFLASHSLNFFQYTFSEQDQIYSYLGLLLTSGGAIGWLAVFQWNADTVLRRGISLVMMGVAVLGELITAVFDMQYNAAYATSAFTDGELRTMTTTIGVFGAVTFLALAAYAVGDKIIWAFGDADGDGLPNIVDPDANYRRRPQEARTARQTSEKAIYAADSETASKDGNPTRAGK